MDDALISQYIVEGRYSEAKSIAEQLKNAISLVYQSRILELTGFFPQALELADLASQRSETKEQQLASAVAAAYAHWRLFSFDLGHLRLDQVSALLNVVNRQSSWIGTYHNIRGLLYWKAEKLEEALDQFQTSLVIRKELMNQSAIAYTLNNIGNTYLKFNDIDRTQQYYSEARQIREMLQHKPALAASANSFGRLYDAKGSHHQAEKEFQLSLSIWKQVGNSQFIAKAYRFLAINAYYRGEDQEKQQHFDASDAIFRDIENETDLNTNRQLRHKFRK